MSDSPADTPRRSPPQSADNEDAPREIDLRSVVVRFDGQPDRCTVYPVRECCCTRTDAWLTADADAFIALDAMR
ncbi:DUF7511 domain-containing protein [Halobellus ordinarius]|uniref:DUF7511 domain-containing protein n=1 Tax=Halobellus ordinarius TaxID=3075120 RepID=UPI0028800273|nr:hypothetical protein [Halobellus sp. ZY16]